MCGGLVSLRTQSFLREVAPCQSPFLVPAHMSSDLRPPFSDNKKSLTVNGHFFPTLSSWSLAPLFWVFAWFPSKEAHWPIEKLIWFSESLDFGKVHSHIWAEGHPPICHCPPVIVRLILDPDSRSTLTHIRQSRVFTSLILKPVPLLTWPNILHSSW